MSRRVMNGVAVSGNGGAELRFLNEIVDDVAKIFPFFKRHELTISADPMLYDLASVIHLFARTEFVDDIIHELEQFIEKQAERHLFPLSEIDQLAFDSETRRARL